VAFAAKGPQEEDGVRGSFITSRPATPPTKPPRRKRRRKSGTNSNSSQTTNANSNENSGSLVNKHNSNGVGTVTASGPIGVGYTLFMRSAFGEAVRVDPAREFHTKDSIRISLESNTDGYLYVFHTENDGQPEMIFPDARLDDGNNEINAHVPYEVPSSKETDESFRWFTFTGNPAKERLYFVVTREPLKDVPTDEDLIKCCKVGKDTVPWKPSPAIWAQLKKEADSHVIVSKSKDYGQAQTAGEKDATARGIGLAKTAPEPSVVRMNASSTYGMLVTSLDLTHQ
jgi:hypothetical protein